MFNGNGNGIASNGSTRFDQTSYTGGFPDASDVVGSVALSAREDLRVMESEIKRKRAGARMAEGLASMMRADRSITLTMTVAELIATLRA